MHFTPHFTLFISHWISHCISLNAFHTMLFHTIQVFSDFISTIFMYSTLRFSIPFRKVSKHHNINIHSEFLLLECYSWNHSGLGLQDLFWTIGVNSNSSQDCWLVYTASNWPSNKTKLSLKPFALHASTDLGSILVVGLTFIKKIKIKEHLY